MAFATLTTLPKSLEWDSSAIKHILSESGVLLMPPVLEVSVSNPIKAIKVLRKFNKLKKLPEKQTLQDMLPEDLYRQYLAQKTKYAPKNKKMDRYRPLEAGKRLFELAKKKTGLTDDRKIIKQISKIS